MNIEKAITWGLSKIGRVKYSMYGSRNTKDGTADCSGFIYQALIEGGLKPISWIPNTDSFHSYLLNNGFYLVSTSNLKRGDVIIWGKKGSSGGSYGHMGIMLDSINWLECTAYKSLGVTKQNYKKRLIMNGFKDVYVYRAKVIASKWVAEKGTFTLNTTIVLRSGANTSSGIITTLKRGDRVKYDRYMVDTNGYVWIRQPRNKGYAYMATGNSVNGKRTSYWGTFS